MSFRLNSQYQLPHRHAGGQFLGKIASRLVALLLGSLALVCSCRGEISPTNHPYAGISWYSITRAQPPMRMVVAEIDLTDPKVRVLVSPGGPDPDGDGPWQTTLMPPTRIAARDSMELVVNGDFFRARGSKVVAGSNSPYQAALWSAVTGPAVTDGKVWSINRDPRPCLVVSKHNTLTIEMRQHPKPDDAQVVAGNTLLVDHGVALPHKNKARHPRTAVGLAVNARRLVILVVDGRVPGMAIGMNYDELAAEMIRLGCVQALNLDGGGSSIMALRNPESGKYQILNHPSDGRERPVANVLGVTILGQQPPALLNEK